MDPTVTLAESKYSFNRKDSIILPKELPKSDTPIAYKFRLSPNVYYPVSQELTGLYQQLTLLKEQISKIRPDLYEYALNKTNKFYFGKSIFESVSNAMMAKEGNSFIKMANIDTIFNITGVMRKVNAAEQYLEESKTKDIYRFCSIEDGPGGFTKYIQFRRPGSYGYGMSTNYTPDPMKRNWNLSELDPNRFDVLSGSDGTGNFLAHFLDVISYQDNSKPLDLFMGNYGNGENEINISAAFLLEIYTGSTLLKEGGNLVLRCYEIFTNLSIDLIQLLIYGFDKVYIFKPCSSPYSSSESYIIAMGRNTVKIDEIAKVLIDNYGKINRIFEKTDPELLSAIDAHNVYIMKSQIETLNRVIAYAKDVDSGREADINHSNTDKYLILWSLPSNSSYKILDIPPPKIKLGTGISGSGRYIFGIYNYLFKNWVDKTNDRMEKGKNLLNIRAYLIDVVFGLDNKYPSEYPDDKWAHTEEETTYKFALGRYTRRYSKDKIDALLKKVNFDWPTIYDLVERYFPFRSVSLDSSFYSLDQTEAFSSPLYNMTEKYTSFYDEDKVFGSMGKFFDVYPNSDLVWNVHPSISEYMLNRLDRTLKPDVKTVVYVQKIESLPFVSKLLREWTCTDVNVRILDHTTNKVDESKALYIKAVNF